MAECLKREYPYLYRTLKVNSTQEKFEKLDAQRLICPQRFDFMAKFIFLKGIDGKYDQGEAKKIYDQHIEAIQDYFIMEPGQNEKRELFIFERRFQEMFRSGMNCQRDIIFTKVIPVDQRWMALDGAHRTCVSSYFNKKISVLRLCNYSVPYMFDYRFFRWRLLDERIMLAMAEEYTHWKPTVLLSIRNHVRFTKIQRAVCNEMQPVFIWRDRQGGCHILLERDSERNTAVADSLRKLGFAIEIHYEDDTIRNQMKTCGIPCIVEKKQYQYLIRGLRIMHKWYRILLYRVNKFLRRPV